MPIFSSLRRWWASRKRPARPASPPPEEWPAPQHPQAPAGTCATCGFIRANECTIRAIKIEIPDTVYCRNYESPEQGPRLGPIYAIVAGRCLPWLGAAIPYPGEATCLLCKQPRADGVLLEHPEGRLGFCGADHYVGWWNDYQRRRFEFFQKLGEHAYGLMYDAIRPGSATGHYADAKDAFADAIAIARDLGLNEKAKALEARLAHIQQVFRRQF